MQLFHHVNPGEFILLLLKSRECDAGCTREEKGLEAWRVPDIESLVDAVDRVHYIVILLLYSWSTYQMTVGQL